MPSAVPLKLYLLSVEISAIDGVQIDLTLVFDGSEADSYPRARIIIKAQSDCISSRRLNQRLSVRVVISCGLRKELWAEVCTAELHSEVAGHGYRKEDAD